MYKNSSRETLMAVLKQNGLEKDCLMHVREKYVFLEVLSIIFSAWFEINCTHNKIAVYIK